MKSAYELAMERLEKSAPMKKISEAQREEILELESRYKAKIAEREVFIKGQVGKAMAEGKWDEVQEFEGQWVREKKALEMELEEKKDAIRNQ